MSARNEGKEKPAREGNPCGLGSYYRQMVRNVESATKQTVDLFSEIS